MNIEKYADLMICDSWLQFGEGGRFIRTSRHVMHSVYFCESEEAVPLLKRLVSGLPTAVVRVRVRAVCGVYGGQSGTGAGFLRLLLFPLSMIIPPISPSS
jgi:hypothetical protein